MKLRTAPNLAVRSELVIVLVAEGVEPDGGPSLRGAIAAAKATGDLRTGARQTGLFHGVAKGKDAGPARLGTIGLGPVKQVDTEGLRRASAAAQALAESAGVRAFQLATPAKVLGDVGVADAAAALAEGLILGAYRYEPPRKDKPKARKAQDAALVLLGDGKHQKDWGAGAARGRIGAEATVFARDLGNQAGNQCTPTAMAAAAKKLAGGGVRVKVLDVPAMKKLGMGALLGVARGSSEPPKFIVFEHGPASAKDTVCIVGKGLTFDSGGISIKPASKMDEMRYDMCGGGAVLGLFHAIRHGALAGSKHKRRVIGLVAAAENMPGPDAQKPGDIVRAMDGHTIEVLNTDAEGRLVLADAIAYAKKFYEPKQIVDLATLTGAVVVALGHEVAGVMGNDQDLVDALIAAGKRADEPVWQLPLWPVHKEQLKSKFADLANINGGQGGGTIAGAAFLSYFAGDTPWAHLDIAGTAWGGVAKDYYKSGAAGTAVRMLVSFLRD
ncbi:MAG: leucyl aminopeptidase [Planctomycetota bacterium]